MSHLHAIPDYDPVKADHGHDGHCDCCYVGIQEDRLSAFFQGREAAIQAAGDCEERRPRRAWIVVTDEWHRVPTSWKSSWKAEERLHDHDHDENEDSRASGHVCCRGAVSPQVPELEVQNESTVLASVEL